MGLIEKFKDLKTIFAYRVNRPLTQEERACQLPQNKPSPIPVAWPQFSVVRMNSTYLELVDQYFMRKGFATIGCFVFLYIAGLFLSLPILDFIENFSRLTGNKFVEMVLFDIFFLLLFVPVAIFFIWLLRHDSFDYTHYPMRFNRKTRMVHVFTSWGKGEIFSAPWDEMFFNATMKGVDGAFAIRGHKLAKDGKTVLATFQLPKHSEWDSEYRFLQWEFVRQYMEGDDNKVTELANMVEEVMGVGGRRETPYESFRQAWAAFAGPYLHLFIIASPLILLTTIGRQIAMWTSKIPRWPEEIEATCQVSPDDPNLRDDKHLAPRGSAKMLDVSAYVER